MLDYNFGGYETREEKSSKGKCLIFGVSSSFIKKPIYPSIYLPVFLSLSLSTYLPSVHPANNPPTYLSTYHMKYLIHFGY